MSKRIFDVVVSIAVLAVALPILAVVWLVVRIGLGSPVLFRQARAGKSGRSFRLLKFRTMASATDAKGIPLPDEMRLTPLGRVLRKTSLDELPQLWNVLSGEMSLVGPRPLHLHYLGRYSSEQARRHEVCPGITGWAQVKGRNSVSWEAKFQMDVWYVDHQSFWLDIRILGMTVWKVIHPSGINSEGEATMSEFQGTSNTSYNFPSRGTDVPRSGSSMNGSGN